MIRVFDFHTHILPAMDDGSKSVRESIEMIRALKRQGAYGIAATPHFYASRTSPERFFAEREAAWERLKPHLEPSMPQIRLGAEVQYYEGMHYTQGLERFCIEGTRLLLIEMPECAWTSRMVATVLKLNDRRDITVLLAHIERCLSFRNHKAFKTFWEEGVLMQASTRFFMDRPWRAMRMLKKEQIHFLGTDTHNMTTRRPDLEGALEIITKKKGAALLYEMAKREEAQWL